MSAERVLIEPFTEPDGRTTWAARWYVWLEGYYAREIIRWFETRAEGESWLAEAAVPLPSERSESK